MLGETSARAAEFLEGLDGRRVSVAASADELRRKLGGPLPDGPTDAAEVIGELARDVEDGLLASGSGRFYGWVIGGAVPASLAADWLTTAWDQNGAIYATSPAAAVVEEICGDWLKQLFGLPETASFALVTGCQMAHVTALAAARSRLLADRGVDVEREGLSGQPPVRILASELRHESLVRAVRLLGIGTDSIVGLATDPAGRIELPALERALEAEPDAPTIVALQAGELNSGAFDRLAEATSAARAVGAWVHVDGAFGLWAAACAERRHLLEGVELADSWATDGHKWLNVPYDSGYAFVADPDAHRSSMTMTASYFVHESGARDAVDWNPEWSRRARGFTVYAAIRALGRDGIDALVERCCRHASALVSGIGSLPGAEVVVEPVINQGLVRFLASDGDHDRRTDEVIDRIRGEGTAWFGGTAWRGQRVMRISVSSWRTTEDDVERTIKAVRRALERAE